MVEEGLIDPDQAIWRVEPDQLNQLLHPTIDPDADLEVIATGLPASPGAAVGKAVFDADHAVEIAPGIFQMGSPEGEEGHSRGHDQGRGR